MTTHSELWKRYRPKTLKEVVGQKPAVDMLEGYLKNKTVPHAILMIGPSGVGKSTIAHILAHELGCRGLDKEVINCATVEDPTNTIRDLQIRMKLSPSNSSKCRVHILEEMQSLSRATFAQQAMLLLLESDEKSTEKTYIIGCTTNPEKLRDTIRNRCKKIEVQSMTASVLEGLIKRIAAKEKKEVPESVVDSIIEVAGGSAREAVNQLDSALTVWPDEKAMLNVLSSLKETDRAWKLKQALFWQKPKWSEICEIIKDITRNEKESFRHQVLKIAAGAMLKNDKFSERAAFVVDVFMDDWEKCMESGLEYACWRVYREFGK